MTGPVRSSCPINASLELLGDRWSLLIVRDMVFGGARAFKDFLASDERISTNILASRLVRLQSYGIITGAPNPVDGRGSVYTLTAKGVQLVPVLMELSRWGTRFAGGQPPPGILEAWTADPQGFMDRLQVPSAPADR